MAIVKSFYDDEDEKLKTSTGEAEAAPLVGGGGSAGGAQPKQADYTKSNFVSGKSLIAKNQNASMPKNLADGTKEQWGQVRDQSTKQLGGWTADIGTEVDSYKATNANLDKAVAGDQAWVDKVSTNLFADPALKAKTYKSMAAPNVAEANAFNSSAGIQDTFNKREQGRGNFNYTQGQGALDSTLFGRSQAGANLRQDVGKAYGNLTSGLASDTGAAKKAQEDGLASVQGIQGEMKTGLEARAGALTDTATKAAAKLNDRTTDFGATRKLVNDMSPAIDNEISKIIATNYAGEDPWVQDQIRERLSKGYNDLQFVNFGEADGPQYDAQGAGQFNNIMTMLGKGGHVGVGKGRGADGVNVGALNEIITSEMPGIRERFAALPPAPGAPVSVAPKAAPGPLGPVKQTPDTTFGEKVVDGVMGGHDFVQGTVPKKYRIMPRKPNWG